MEYIITVNFCHGVHAFKGVNLTGDLLTSADHIVCHGAIAAVSKIVPLLFNKKVNTVKSNAAIVAYNVTADIGALVKTSRLI